MAADSLETMLQIGLGELVVIAVIGGVVLVPVFALGVVAWLALPKKKP
ncbi:MAG TPA: hypothetical protein VF316_03680 [Polyangiaceae bacterium]